MAIQTVAIPQPGVIASRPRKNPLVDTEGWNAATAIPSTIALFENFSSFATSGMVPTKAFGRDTTLRGGSGGLPVGTHFYLYEWRHKILTYQADISTNANKVVFEEINRARQLCYAEITFGPTRYLVLPLTELPDGTGAPQVQTTWSEITIFSPFNGTPDRKGKQVTISGRPIEISGQQDFRVNILCPSSTGLTPTIDYFHQTVLDGLLLQAMQ